MSIQTNIAKIYLNLDRTVKKVIDPFISRGANNTVQIMLVAPFNIQNSQYVNFELESELEIPTRYMMLVGYENSVDTNNEDWGVWVYSISEKILAGAAANASSILNITFSEFRNTTSPSTYEFIGFQSTEAALNANFPTPADDQYAGVGNGTTIGTSTCYLAINGTWVTQNKTVLQFESDNGILRESFIGESNPEPLSVDPNISTINDEIDNTNLDVIFVNISTLNGKVLTIETLLGIDGDNFVKSDLIAKYSSTSTPEGEDHMYMQKANGDKKRVSFADLAAGARDNFIGTFETASGLTCPDPDDLICTYPNGIADPNDRLGWVANITATNSKWRWVTASNDWHDTGEAPSLAKDVGYEAINDPSTNEVNVQDSMVEHGTKIKVNEDDIIALGNKAQKLNPSGNISENIEIISTKDISSTDLSTGTSGAYSTIIQALIAEYLRNNGQDTSISNNADDIILRLINDFSTLINKSTPADGDLMALWDVTSSTNKNISWAEFKTAIDTSLINDQGWYTNLAALKVAIPIGENGWHATIGDVDTRAVWDSDSADWIEVASKLYYTITQGNTLEIRVGNNETAITAINVTLGNKEDIVNKVDTMVGNEANTIKYLSAKGIFDYINPQILISQEIRKYSKAVQVGLVISRASTNTSLTDGRIDRVEIEGGIVQTPGIAQYSIDGGTILKNIAVYDVASSGYVDLDLSISIVSGSYFTLLYSLALDKWLAIDSNVDVSMVRGAGWLPIMTTAGNYALINTLTLRVDNLEENQGVPALQEVRIITPIVVTTNAIAHELVFEEASIPSNEIDILDVDVNFNHVVKSNTEPGISFDFYGQIKNKGNPGSLAETVFYIANKSAPITAGSFIIGKKYRINSVGTTDFTLIGASGNTIGIVFTATGVGTGTGSALFIFRDIRITAEDQDKENDRSIGFTISNNDYVAPFTPGVYYTKEGVDFNILQVILAGTTLFPSGNAPASSLTTILVDSVTEMRSGIGTKQKTHNEESVVDRKNILESQTVIVVNYQSAGQYMANKPNISLETNKIVRVLFNGSGADVTELVELSLNGGSNYYNVEYRETDVDLTVKNAIVHVMDIYFTGTKFIATYVDSPIENQFLPYVGINGQFEIPKNDVPVHIGEEITEVVKDYKGGTLNGVQLNGNFVDLTVWTSPSSTLTIANNEATVIATATNGRIQQVIETPIGKTYLLSAWVKATSNLVRLIVTDNTTFTTVAIAHSGSGEYELLSVLFTVPVGAVVSDIEYQVRDSRTSAWDNFYVKEYILVEYDNTILDGLTANKARARLEWFESLQSVGSPVVYVPADYDQWIQDMYTRQGVEAGDIIQGIFIESVSKNKFDKLDVANEYEGTGDDVSIDSLDTGIEFTNNITTATQFWQKQIKLVPNTVYNIHRELTVIGSGNANDGYISIRDGEDLAITIVNLAVGTDINFTTPSHGKIYILIYNNFGTGYTCTTQHENLQIQLGTSYDSHEDFIKANAHINEEFGDVPNGTADDFDFKRTIDYTLISSDIEFHSGTNVNLVRILKTSLANYKNVDLDFRIDRFTTTTLGTFDDVANIGKATNNVSGVYVDLIVDKADIPDLATAQSTYTSEKIRYELATYLPRDGIKAPLLDMIGNIITGPKYTYTQISTSGITNEFKATTAVNTKSQIKLNTDAIIDLFKLLINIDGDLDKVIENLAKAISDIGYLPDLTTTAKENLVLAINELITKIGDLTTLTTTDKSNIVNAINEVVNNLSTNYYNKTEVDNLFTALLSGLDWKETVATFADIATTYPTPEDGWTVNVEDTDLTYRYDGATWIKISSNSIPLATDLVDGLMAKTDKAKLDGIESGATADQTDAEIKIAYENNANTNAYTDAEKAKIAHITVTAAINLDKVRKYTELKATNTAISTATTKPASNITLSESMDNYDSLLFPIQKGTGGIAYMEVSFADNGDGITIPYANTHISSTELAEYMVTIERDSSTTLTAYYGGYVLTTFGAVDPSWNAIGHTIYPIYGIKK